MVTRKLGKYELGRTIGEGTFAKVKFAKNTETGENVAIKVMSKATILRHKMVDQIKREISIMKIVRHPNIVRLHEVLSSRTKIYIVLEFVTGGELFDKIVHQGKIKENESRRYFQQLIDAVDYCHRKGVYHRDLKPENLLLDCHGKLKVSDFGLSALPERGILLHTTCGTPNYVAPEINVAEFSCPIWFSPGAKALILKILNPNPKTRISIEGIKRDPWFRQSYVPVRYGNEEKVSLDDVCAVFNDIEDQYVSERTGNDQGPLIMNAFEMITLSQGLNLSALFDRRQDYVKRQTRFVSRKPANDIILAIEAVAASLHLSVHSRNYKMRLEGLSANKIGRFAVALEIYEVAPSLFMVDVRKASGDTLEYHKFYKNLCSKLEHIIWKPTEDSAPSGLLKSMTC
ncbi:CBL-interacting serine/threonine-protein kinase 24-like isoform X3 [Papaver somniferum]|uniref:CBL-interacting serine/threonine-protein kinase 24-like isoform X3 n=1 Tax=Papaver somniferum TaxID=3469 RepID=UPI000E700A22|nr:CBL-interacting serine/threonine-protein kinase 24-like isoform X3 [Papaver somniferum]